MNNEHEAARAKRLAEEEEALHQGVPLVGDYRDLSATLSRRAAPPPEQQARGLDQPQEGAERARQSAVLVACLRGKRTSEVAAALLDGTFHPAVTVDLSLL
jgi:hypothetical protein